MILDITNRYEEIIGEAITSEKEPIGEQKPQLFEALKEGPKDPTYTAILEKREKILDDQDTRDNMDGDPNRRQRFQLLGDMKRKDIIDFLSLAENNIGNGRQEEKYQDMLNIVEQKRGIDNVSNTEIYYTTTNISNKAERIITQLYKKTQEELVIYKEYILTFVVNNIGLILGRPAYMNLYANGKRFKTTVSLTSSEIEKEIERMDKFLIPSIGTGYDSLYVEYLQAYIQVYAFLSGNRDHTNIRLKEFLKTHFKIKDDAENTKDRKEEESNISTSETDPTENSKYTTVINKRKIVLNKNIEAKDVPFSNDWKKRFQVLSNINKEDIIELLSLPENNSGSGAQEAIYMDLLTELGILSKVKGISDNSILYSDSKTSRKENRTIDSLQDMIEKELLNQNKEILSRIKENADSLIGMFGFNGRPIFNVINKAWIQKTGKMNAEEIRKKREKTDRSNFYQTRIYSAGQAQYDYSEKTGLFVFLQARNYLLEKEITSDGLPSKISNQMGDYSEKNLEALLEQVFIVQ